jgi:hypothetical protein
MKIKAGWWMRVMLVWSAARQDETIEVDREGACDENAA